MLTYNNNTITDLMYKKNALTSLHHKAQTISLIKAVEEPCRYWVFAPSKSRNYFSFPRTLGKAWGMKLSARVLYDPVVSPAYFTKFGLYTNSSMDKALTLGFQRVDNGEETYQPQFIVGRIIKWCGYQPIQKVGFHTFEISPKAMATDNTTKYNGYYNKYLTFPSTWAGSKYLDISPIEIPINHDYTDRYPTILVHSFELWNYGEEPFVKCQAVKAGDKIDGKTAAADSLYDFASKTFYTHHNAGLKSPITVGSD